MSHWNLLIQDPSGQTRSLPLEKERSTWSLGHDPEADIPLRDGLVPRIAGRIEALTSQERSEIPSFWARLEEGSPPAILGDLSVRDFKIPPRVPVKIGETVLTLATAKHSPPLPPDPPGVKPWLTCTSEGAQALWVARKAAATSLSVYLAGETGTGKEVLAHLIHNWSERANGPFIPLNCSALALSLAESELFGHERGAFTGAHRQRPGALLQAHGGTLFLDEVGDLPQEIQVKLLRFLENGEIRSVGSDQPIHANVRIICATHKSLTSLVRDQKFRQDLYYRLASIKVEIPPLRRRPEDIRMLAERYASQLGKHLTPQATLRLQAYPWTGNVRELMHAIERAGGLADLGSPLLTEEDFAFLTNENPSEENSHDNSLSVLTLKDAERILLLRSLRLSGGNRTRAAKIMGVGRSTLFEMLKRHRVPGPRTLMRLAQAA